MQLAIVAAGYTPGEADQLRRAMAAWKRTRRPRARSSERLIDGMLEQRLRRASSPSASSSRSRASASTASPRATPRASRCSSTSAAGSSATTRRRSLPRCSTASRWASTRRRSWCRTRSATASRCGRSTCGTATGTARSKRAGRWPLRTAVSAKCARRAAVRLGLDRVSGLAEDGGQRIVAARARGAVRRRRRPGAARRARRAATCARWPQADALHGLAGHRHQAAWAVAGIDTRPTELLRATRRRTRRALALPRRRRRGDRADYRSLGLTLHRHPLALLRAQLARVQASQPARAAAHATRTAGWRAPAASSRSGSGPRPPRARSSSRSRTRPARST